MDDNVPLYLGGGVTKKNGEKLQKFLIRVNPPPTQDNAH